MVKRILIIRYSAFGDVVLTSGPIHLIRKKYPTAIIDFLTSEVGEELFVGNSDIDDIFVIPKGSGFFSIVRKYRKMQSYDVVIDLQGSVKSKLFRFFSKSPFFSIEKQSKERRAFVRDRKHKDELNKHVVEKYYDTVRKALPELSERERKELRPFFAAPPIHMHPDLFSLEEAVVLHPYASQKNKEWPYFTELCTQLIKQKTPVVVVGASSEPLEFPKDAKVLDLTNKTSIREMASFIKKSKALVTTDSGPMHLGVALKTPTIALFGPTTKEFGFYPDFSGVVVLEQDMVCRPCHVHGGNVCPLDHHQCLKSISTQEVLNSLENLPQPIDEEVVEK